VISNARVVPAVILGYVLSSPFGGDGWVVRADQPFRRAEAKYSLDSVGLRVRLNGGALSGVSLEAPGTVAGIARSAQFGELLDFDRRSADVDGVLRSSVRDCIHDRRATNPSTDRNADPYCMRLSTTTVSTSRMTASEVYD
jgi:hypothetical protein